MLLYHCEFWILDFGFWIGGIAHGLRSLFGGVGSLYPFNKTDRIP
jgi:hypothetical protein